MKLQVQKICPLCKSTNIHLWMGAELGVRYRCGECDYMGPLVLEEKTKSRASRKQSLKKIRKKG